jgi:hypothetical protein
MRAILPKSSVSRPYQSWGSIDSDSPAYKQLSSVFNSGGTHKKFDLGLGDKLHHPFDGYADLISKETVAEIRELSGASDGTQDYDGLRDLQKRIAQDIGKSLGANSPEIARALTDGLGNNEAVLASMMELGGKLNRDASPQAVLLASKLRDAPEASVSVADHLKGLGIKTGANLQTSPVVMRS